jgi:hypothetical protein
MDVKEPDTGKAGKLKMTVTLVEWTDGGEYRGVGDDPDLLPPFY